MSVETPLFWNGIGSEDLKRHAFILKLRPGVETACDDTLPGKLSGRSKELRVPREVATQMKLRKLLTVAVRIPKYFLGELSVDIVSAGDKCRALNNGVPLPG
jgi:hypothetical protein